MFKRIVLVTGLSLMVLSVWEQDSKAKTWKNTQVSADSIMAAIERGENVFIDSCEIWGPLTKEGTLQKADTVKGVLSIHTSTFHDKLSFCRCCFMETVAFGHCTFRAGVNFSGVVFYQDGSFSFNIFAEEVSFVFCTFWRDAYFGAATFEKWVTFRGTIFNGRFNLVFASFAKWASFRDVQFRGSVSLSPTEFGSFSRLSWSQLDGHLNYSREANFRLMKHFEERRILEDADEVYLFLKDQERIRKPGWIRYPEYWFIQLTCGYGVKPERVLFLSILIIVFFVFFYAKSNAIEQTEEKLAHLRRRKILRSAPKSLRVRISDAFYFSAQTFIIHAVPGWRPKDEFLIKFWKVKLFKFRTLSLIEATLGWILLVLFVVTLTRKFIR